MNRADKHSGESLKNDQRVNAVQRDLSAYDAHEQNNSKIGIGTRLIRRFAGIGIDLDLPRRAPPRDLSDLFK